MAPTFRAASVAGGATTAISVPAPTGVVAGDFQVVAVMLGTGSETITSAAPAGWTLLGNLANNSTNTFNAYVYMSTTATGALALTKSGTRPYRAVRAAYSNHGGYRASSFNVVNRGGAAAAAITARTTVLADSLVIGGSMWDGNDVDVAATCTPPAGWTERSDTNGGSAAEYLGQTVADVAVAAPGSVAGTFNWSASSGSVNAWALVLDSGTLMVRPTGIPSAEAFGTATMQPGGVTITGAGGIPSAEAFGTPGVAPGQSVDDVGGIGTAEAFGTPTVVPGAAVTKPSGIGSGEAFGRPTMVPGTVTLTGIGGIPSGEEFGQPTLSFGIAETDLPRAYPRTEVAYPAVQYELVMVARVPQTQGPPLLLEVDPIDWTGLTYSDELSRAQTLDATCKLSNMTPDVITRVRNLSELGSELWLYRQGKKVFAGPLLGATVQDEAVTLQALGLLAYMRFWTVWSDLIYTGVDQHLIVKGLTDHWQGQEYGHFGINTTAVTPGGVLRDATFLAKELPNIGKVVEDMGKGAGGFDAEVDPASRDLRLWTPGKGVDRSAGEDAVIFDSRNVTSGNIVISAAPGDVASEAFGTGTSNDVALYGVASNPELRSSFGRTSVTGTFDGVSEQPVLDAFVKGLVDARGAALVVPGPDVRTTTDADLAAYEVGDTVQYNAHERLGVTGAYRVRKRTVTVSEIGREKSKVEFV